MRSITRDLLIGVVPPGAVADWRYLGVSLFAGIITFCFSSLIVRLSNPVLLFDAAGLALFAVTGASKALAHGLNPVMAIVLGMVTGIGGGMVRDVLLAEIPTVLRAELYTVAALAAAAHRSGRTHVAVAGCPGDRGGAYFMLHAPRSWRSSTAVGFRSRRSGTKALPASQKRVRKIRRSPSVPFSPRKIEPRQFLEMLIMLRLSNREAKLRFLLVVLRGRIS